MWAVRRVRAGDGGDQPGAEGAVGVAEREGEDEGQRRGPAGEEVGEDRRARRRAAGR